MEKTNFKSVSLGKGEVNVYDFGEVKLHAYKTNDLIDDEVFVLEKNGNGVCIELPCFFDNISEFNEYLKNVKIDVKAKLVAYHAAGDTFLSDVPSYGTKSSDGYNTNGGGAGLVKNFAGAFGAAFDSSICKVTNIIGDGEIELAGIKFVIKSTSEAFDIEIPEINCVYTHMLGHDVHSIVAGIPHADSIIMQLENYIEKGVTFILTSHYTPEDLKDAETKIAYLKDLKTISGESGSADDMKTRVSAKFPKYGGMNYLEMTSGFFFPKK